MQVSINAQHSTLLDQHAMMKHKIFACATLHNA